MTPPAVARRCTRRVVAALLPLLFGACSGDAVLLDLPAGAQDVPGRAVVAAWSAEPGHRLPWPIPAEFAERLHLESHDDVAGWTYATSELAPAGWATLADSRLFRAAWQARPDFDARYVVFADLQAVVDRAMTEFARRDRMLRRMLEPLGVSTLEWALFAVDDRRPMRVEGRIRASDGSYGALATLGGVAAPSLLGPPTGDERLRIELRFDGAVARRTLDASLGPGDGMSSRDAMLGVFAPIVRAVLDQFDGTATAVVDAEERLTIAVGLRDPDDARDALDRFLKREAAETWSFGGRTATVVGNRLLVSDDGATVGEPGGPPIDDALFVAFRGPLGVHGTVRVRREDRVTLSVSARIE